MQVIEAPIYSSSFPMRAKCGPSYTLSLSSSLFSPGRTRTPCATIPINIATARTTKPTGLWSFESKKSAVMKKKNVPKAVPITGHRTEVAEQQQVLSRRLQITDTKCLSHSRKTLNVFDLKLEVVEMNKQTQFFIKKFPDFPKLVEFTKYITEAT